MQKYLTILLALFLLAPALADSGLKSGDKTPAHNPKHITGPDAGTTVCPV